MPKIKSRINPDYEYDENMWVISILSTAGRIGGHAAIVVEGLETGGIFTRPFIGQYDISANAGEDGGSINVTGIITKIKCYENEKNTRDYEREGYPACSYYATPAKAKEMIAAIKRDELLTDQAMENLGRRGRERGEALILGDDRRPIEPLRYQKLGMDHFLVKLLGNSADGDNCAGWCLKKLAIADIGDGHGKPKPYWQAGQRCVLL